MRRLSCKLAKRSPCPFLFSLFAIMTIAVFFLLRSMVTHELWLSEKIFKEGSYCITKLILFMVNMSSDLFFLSCSWHNPHWSVCRILVSVSLNQIQKKMTVYPIPNSIWNVTRKILRKAFVYGSNFWESLRATRVLDICTSIGYYPKKCACSLYSHIFLYRFYNFSSPVYVSLAINFFPEWAQKNHQTRC